MALAIGFTAGLSPWLTLMLMLVYAFTVPGDWTRLDERALSASLVAASAAISGRGSVRRVEVVSQSPRRRTGMQTAR